ncbi:putative SOS response-associated peptidase YedK [Novosphingobium sp. PhB165]|uniref:SOS response-associated peptidase n=1 Tax=Novosphingobium sp. PhB165 TaxID=2485105 RepID=UPI00104D18AA|nr:SOS response-associated peptidase family protein [Novosphingobium sp. PhB165]TCM17190.1 putative SOS response-associated peptidase YedK [Novosphingobium sp. PhB165]
MCNLYRMTSPADAVAKLFSAMPAVGANFASEVYPKYTGLVIAEGAVRTMTWGFPRHAVSKKTGKALKPTATNNARDDKLRGNPMWRDSFRDRRCLIPVTAWAEAEGEAGRMTRTWYSLPGGEPFIVAGIWTPTIEWGDAYSMVMVPGSEQMSDVHDRMPTILPSEDRARWTDGTPDEAFSLLRTWELPLVVDRTDVPWIQRSAPATSKPPILL